MSGIVGWICDRYGLQMWAAGAVAVGGLGWLWWEMLP